MQSTLSVLDLSESVRNKSAILPVVLDDVGVRVVGIPNFLGEDTWGVADLVEVLLDL